MARSLLVARRILPLPSPPDIILASQITSDSISIEWAYIGCSEDAIKGYLVIDVTDVNNEPLLLGKGQPSSSFKISNLAPLKQYCFVVSAVDVFNRVSEKSVSKCFETSIAGSDECMQVLSPGYWKHRTSNWGPVPVSQTFFDTFGGEPLFPGDTTAGKTLLQVLQNPGGSPTSLGGPNNVNFFLVSFYLMAANHGSLGIVFPVIGPGKPFASLDQYADYLYAEAQANPAGVGTTLSGITDNYHLGDGNICPN